MGKLIIELSNKSVQGPFSTAYEGLPAKNRMYIYTPGLAQKVEVIAGALDSSQVSTGLASRGPIFSCFSIHLRLFSSVANVWLTSLPQ